MFLPNEVLANLADGLARVVALLHERHILHGTDLTFGLNALGCAHLLLGGLEIGVDALPATLAQTHLSAHLGEQISLFNFAFDRVRNLTDNLNHIFALGLNGTRQTNAEHVRDFSQHIVNFLLKIDLVVDDAQVRMSGPGLNEFVVECDGLFNALAAHLIVGSSVELLGAIGSGDQV